MQLGGPAATVGQDVLGQRKDLEDGGLDACAASSPNAFSRAEYSAPARLGGANHFVLANSTAMNPAELSVTTFCTFLREFSPPSAHYGRPTRAAGGKKKLLGSSLDLVRSVTIRY
jgi:hypothetical protein